SMGLRAALFGAALVFVHEGRALAQPEDVAFDTTRTPTEAEKENARAFGREGITLYEAGQYKEALEQFREASALSPTPQATLYMARCHAKLGQLIRSLGLYSLLGDPGPDASKNARDAYAAAQEGRKALIQRIPRLTIAMPAELLAGSDVTLD